MATHQNFPEILMAINAGTGVVRSICLIVRRGDRAPQHMNRDFDGAALVVEGGFSTGYWARLPLNVLAGAVGAHVSLHEAKNQPSWRQGVLREIRRDVCNCPDHSANGLRGLDVTILIVTDVQDSVEFHIGAHQHCSTSLSLDARD